MKLLVGIIFVALGATLLTVVPRWNALVHERDPVRLVERAFKDIGKLNAKTADHLNMSDAQRQTLANPRMDNFIDFQNLVLTQDPNDHELVHYRMTIPGVAALALNIVGGKHFPNASRYVKRIPIQGTFRIATHPSGRRYIDIAAGKDPLSLYLSLTFPSTLPVGYRKDGKYGNDSAFLLALSGSIVWVRDKYDSHFNLPIDALWLLVTK